MKKKFTDPYDLIEENDEDVNTDDDVNLFQINHTLDDVDSGVSEDLPREVVEQIQKIIGV